MANQEWEKAIRKCLSCPSTEAEILVRTDGKGRRKLLAYRCMNCGDGKAQKVDRQAARYRQLRFSVPFSDAEAYLDEAILLANMDGLSFTELSRRLWCRYSADSTLRDRVRNSPVVGVTPE